LILVRWGAHTPHHILPDVGKKYTRIGAVAEADSNSCLQPPKIILRIYTGGGSEERET
jgi:hypothetical protein